MHSKFHMFVIGTAGHVDHGKSLLVKALTGIDPDRLPEEKKRGMTIDLGFAWLALPEGTEIGIVDVPGHERFVKNMIAGVGGIDAALLVIAADDGWMPQTQEHLEILELLGVGEGIVVINKIDLVKEEWLGLVEQDIKQKLKGTFLEKAAVVKTSATQGIGIEELKDQIKDLNKKLKVREDIGKPRLYIDRVFTMSGMGTIVTGTLIDGTFRVGEEVEIVSAGVKTRIKNIQRYKKQVDFTGPGTRVALNLMGVEKEKIQRGDVIVNPGGNILTSFLDVKVQMIPGSPFAIKNGSEYLFMLGTSEILGRIILLQKDQFESGESGFARIKLREPVLGRIGDHFILRMPSPPRTLGGGLILDVFPSKLKRKDKELLSFLTRRENLDLLEIIRTELKKVDFLPIESMLKASVFSYKEIESAINHLESNKDIIVRKKLVVNREKWEKLLALILEGVKKEHKDKPYASGLRISDLISRIKYKEKLISEGIDYLLSTGKLIQKDIFLAFPEHKPQLMDKQTPLAQEILGKFEKNPLSPPTKGELLKENPGNHKIILFLLQQERLVELKEGILYRKEDFEEITRKIRMFIKEKGPSTVSQLREYLNITRKYAVPILEKLDELGITQREGDKRVLGNR
ncbi:MAG: selenocysteine-specific translation elongation factor [candidate division Zixibacteria bacterium]|nr:selenocysteine-specific translation elongation factor [candidate division Zixibacteria bacterium]